MWILGLVICVAYVGIGIVVPLFPFFGTRIDAPPEAITTAMAMVAAGQLVSTPLWGWASDRLGRKPVLIVSLLGSAAASLVLAASDSVALLLLSRLLAGLFTGINAVAFAAVADVALEGTKRARLMGRIGAAFSLGFILGAALGGLLSGSAEDTNYRFIALVVAALDLAAAALALLLFRETLSSEARAKARARASASVKAAALAEARSIERVSRVQHEEAPDAPPQRHAILRTLHDPMLRRLAIVHLAFGGAFAVVDSTLALFAVRTHDFTPAQMGYTFMVMGVLTTAVQGLMLGRLTGAIGALDTVLLSLLVLALGHGLVAASDASATMIAGCLAFAASLGLFLAPSSSLVAARAAEHERGALLGVFQGAGNLGKVLAPLTSGLLFTQVAPSAPFVASALLMAPAVVLLLAARRDGATAR